MSDNDRKPPEQEKVEKEDEAEEQTTYVQEINKINNKVQTPPNAQKSPQKSFNIDFIRERGFKLKDQIGQGKFSIVFKATWTKMPGVDIACKQIQLDEVDDDWKDNCLNRELTIATQLKHKNIIEVYKVFRSQRVVFIFMQFASNGSIRDYMIKRGQPIKETPAKMWWSDLMAGLAYMHSKGMAHRDIKLDNFLLNNDFKAIISDFGFAVHDPNNPQKLLKQTICGTIDYMAPEVQNANPSTPYDAKVADIYSMGVCLFEIVNFDRPFKYDNNDSNLIEILEQKRKRSYRFHKRIAKVLTQHIKDLIFKLLEPDPKKRISIQSILEHKALA